MEGIDTADDRVPMTFLFTDIEGSTRRWEHFPSAMPDAIERHDQLVDGAVAGKGGVVFHRSGDGVIASFENTAAAVEAAIEIQRRLAADDWSAVDTLRVRIGIHRGEVVLREGEPFGWALNYGARFSGTAEPGEAGHPACVGGRPGDRGVGRGEGLDVVIGCIDERLDGAGD